jgi:hypothetical protein
MVNYRNYTNPWVIVYAIYTRQGYDYDLSDCKSGKINDFNNLQFRVQLILEIKKKLFSVS